ncbi:MAG: hypothetical protein R3E01_34980 [Pirellulaceae bacterium]|nr:hypothetical protein [Planctomycetales bacterium]
MNREGETASTFGFVTITESTELGYIGGLLLLNRLARPIEFHCTVPVKANRAQEILYGPTLRSYLCGERIGPALLEKTKVAPQLVFTDQWELLDARAFVTMPILFVVPPPNETPAAELAVPPMSSSAESASLQLELGSFALRAHHDFASDAEMATLIWQQSDVALDLREPFERIHEAIREAHRSAA